METFRIFLLKKNEPYPEGGLTPEGSLSISATLKAEGNTRCRLVRRSLGEGGSHFFASSRGTSRAFAASLLGGVRKYTPAVVHCKNTTCTNDISQNIRRISVFFVQQKTNRCAS